MSHSVNLKPRPSGAGARSYRDLRNVDANYPLERSHRFAGIQPKFWPWRLFAFELRRWEAQLGAQCQDLGRMLALAGIAEIFCRCRDDPAAANPAIPLLTLCWTFSAKRASAVVTDSEPDRLAPLPRQRPVASAG